MKLLALETANEQCSISLIDETQELFFQLDTRAKAQTQTILPMIEQGLQQTGLDVAGLDAIAFSRGPGSFSGVRINAAVAQALAGHKIYLWFPFLPYKLSHKQLTDLKV